MLERSTGEAAVGAAAVVDATCRLMRVCAMVIRRDRARYASDVTRYVTAIVAVVAVVNEYMFVTPNMANAVVTG